MNSHGTSGSPDVRPQRGYVMQSNPRAAQDNAFGVRVQVQGIKGQPFVVLNSTGQESHRDISVITHQVGYNPGMVRRSVDERRSPVERTLNSSMLHYQKHPEILRPYDPESNNLNLVIPSQTGSASRPGQQHIGTNHTTNGTKPRIPLPAESLGEDPYEVIQSKCPPSGVQIPSKPPNPVDTDSIVSVGRLISQFNNSQRRGRGPRHRLDSQACHRSRSVDSGRMSDSSSSSSASSRASSLKGIRGETLGGIYPPGSARARLLSDNVVANRREENKPNSLYNDHRCEDVAVQRSSKPSVLAEKTTISLSHIDQTDQSDDRDILVTPDLLKGQQELSADPPHEATQQILFTYLKDG